MSNFALTTGDPYGDVISSVNYLLATQGQGSIGNLGNALVANATTGQITTSNDPNYLAYLYQYIDVRYADSADGSVNFSTSPTNRLYFGVRNYTTGGGSSNPADYIWTQVAGGSFSTNRFLYFQTNGGRQIQFAVATSPPGPSWVVTTNAVAIDLDVLSASLVNTSQVVLYSSGQTFNRNTANVWSPANVGNIVSTISNISAIRNNVVIAAIGQTISYNTAAQTWTTTTNPSPNVNSNSFTFGSAVTSSQNYYRPVFYVDTYANIATSQSVTVVTSGQNGANGAAGADGLTITSFYDGPTTFIQSNNSSWSPNTNINGYINSNVTITAARGNTVAGRITRRVTYNANNTWGNYTGPTYGVLTLSSGSWITSSKVDGYYYYLLVPGFTGSGNITVSGGANITADVLMVGPGAPVTYDASGVLTGGIPGGGGEVKYYPNITFSSTSIPYFIGYNGGPSGFGSNVTFSTFTANVGQTFYAPPPYGYPQQFTTGGSGAGGVNPVIVDNSVGRAGTPNPWSADLVSAFPLEFTPGTRLFATNQNNGSNVTVFGGGGGGYTPGLNPVYAGGVGGGQQSLTAVGGPNTIDGYFGGGGAGGWRYYTPAKTPMPRQAGCIILRIPAVQIDNNSDSYANIWVMNSSNVTDINPSRFTLSTLTYTAYTYSRNVNYVDSNGSGNINVTYSAVPTNQGERGFIPLAYVVTDSDPTTLTNAQLTVAFSSPRTAVVAPIGTGYYPITGDTAQFIYPPTGVSVVKTYNGDTGVWSVVDGQVIDGNVIVTGTITANKLATNDVYALTIQSTSATTGSNTSPGFWLQANTGNARFGGGINIGNSLVVGNNAVIGTNLIVSSNANIGNNLTVGNNAIIGGNLNVSGLITTGNLNSNTVNTGTITSNSVTTTQGYSNQFTYTINSPVSSTFYVTTNTLSVNATAANTPIVSSGSQEYYLWANILGNVPQTISVQNATIANAGGTTYYLSNFTDYFVAYSTGLQTVGPLRWYAVADAIDSGAANTTWSYRNAVLVNYSAGNVTVANINTSGRNLIVQNYKR